MACSLLGFVYALGLSLYSFIELGFTHNSCPFSCFEKTTSSFLDRGMIQVMQESESSVCGTMTLVLGVATPILLSKMSFSMFLVL